jgi:hypothetical protein
LENIDEEADIYGIDFVKNDEAHAARHFHIYNTPALVTLLHSHCTCTSRGG